MPDTNHSNEKARTLFQPVHIALLFVAIIGLMCIWFWPNEAPSQNEHSPTVITPDTPTASVPTPTVVAQKPPVPEPIKPIASEQPVENAAEEAKAPLPTLNNSDTAVTQDIQELQLTGTQNLLANEYILRKIVRAAVAASNGEWINQHPPFAPIKTPFKAMKKGNKLLISPNNFTRYTPYIDALEQIGSKRIGQMYRKYRPLMQEAYEELGLKQGDFHSTTLKALDTLLSAPAYSDVALRQPSVMYTFDNKSLEALPEAQKIFFRMGPDNQKRLKALMKEVKDAIQGRA